MNNTVCNPTDEQILIPAAVPHEDEKGVRLEVALPGVRKEDLKIKLNQFDLEISAPRYTNIPENWKTRGPAAPPVRYQFKAKLTQRLDGGKIQANLENGVLTLLIPFSEAAKPREILVS